MSTHRQLKQQIAELEKKAAIAIKKEARTVIERIKQQIAEFGLTAADLGLEIARRAAVKTRAKRTKRVLTPKYREPTTGKTWNGHGKRPGWIVAAQEKGKLEELLIAKPALARVAPQAKPAKSAAKKAQTKATPLPKRAAKKRAKKPAAAAPKKRVAERKAAATKPVAKKRAAPAKRPQRVATRATPAPTEVTA
jgi:DNA-binding protein H-NS